VFLCPQARTSMSREQSIGQPVRECRDTPAPDTHGILPSPLRIAEAVAWRGCVPQARVGVSRACGAVEVAAAKPILFARSYKGKTRDRTGKT
jgi:hypothetical protein